MFGRSSLSAKDFSTHVPLTDTVGQHVLRTMKQSADKKLAARLIKGDSRSFDVFFNSYFPRIYRFALSRLNNDHNLAEDTAQNVLCQALSKISTYRGEAPLFSWLCTFCRYEISKQLRARGCTPGNTALIDDNPAVRSALESLLSSSKDDPDVQAYQAELSGLVRVALDHLPALYADTLECKYVHGYSVRFIANRIGKSEKATESILTRARLAFRDCFVTLINHQQYDPHDSNLSSIFE
jgi:RNA polymerase sigma-70 factor (ECF subfamily)